MTRAIVVSLLAAHLSLVVSTGQAGPISRDAYVAVIVLDGTYLSDFRLMATGLEFVKFGAPPLALTDVSQPTSIGDFSGFTETDPLDHRLVFLSFENLSTGGLFSADGDISTFTITPQLSPSLFVMHFEATLSSGFGGLPITTIDGTFLYDALAPPSFVSADGREAQYTMLSSSATVGGTLFTPTDGFVSVQNDLTTSAVPEPASVIIFAAFVGMITMANLLQHRRARE